MPKTEIDYSNTIIYKIICKDVAVTDVYVGHTTNFVQRKYAHKQSCNNLKSTNYNSKVYEVIREKGGWNNWKMEIINLFVCKDHYEARKKEQEYFISLNANLNSIEPMPKPKVIEAAIEEDNKKNNHIEKNAIITSVIKQTNDTDIKYSCIECKYTTSRNSQYMRHLQTSKHIKNLQSKKSVSLCPKQFTCSNCNKLYTDRSGLWKHNKTCKTETNTIIEPQQDDIKHLTSLVMELMKSNSELTQQLSEIRNMLINNTTATTV